MFQIKLQVHDLILLADYQNRFSKNLRSFWLFLIWIYVLCFFARKMPLQAHTAFIHVVQMSLFLCLRSCCQNLLICTWQTWEHIKVSETSTAKPWPCFFSLVVSALRESKWRDKALSVSAVCLDLTFVYVCVFVWVHVWWATSKYNGEAHLLWPLTLAYSETEGGCYRGEKDTGKHTNTRTHARTKKGGIHATVSKFTTARKTTMDRDIAICLVNFYWDLYAGAHKQLYRTQISTHIKKVKQEIPICSLCIFFCGTAHPLVLLNLSDSEQLYCIVSLTQSVANVQNDSHLTLVWTWRVNGIVSWPWDEHFISPSFHDLYLKWILQRWSLFYIFTAFIFSRRRI